MIRKWDFFLKIQMDENPNILSDNAQSVGNHMDQKSEKEIASYIHASLQRGSDPDI